MLTHRKKFQKYTFVERAVNKIIRSEMQKNLYTNFIEKIYICMKSGENRVKERIKQKPKKYFIFFLCTCYVAEYARTFNIAYMKNH